MGALPRQTVPVVLGKRDGAKSPKTSIPGSLTLLENMVQTQEDRYEKRHGSARLGTLPGGTASRVHVTASGELVATDTGRLYSWNEAQQRFDDKGYVGNYVPRVREIAEKVTFSSVQTVSLMGRTFVFWLNAGTSGYRWCVIDEATGAMLVNGASFTVLINTQYRVVAVDRYVLIFGLIGATPNLFVHRIDVDTPTTVSSGVQLDDAADTGVNFFDAYVHGSTVEVMWQPKSSSTVLRLRRWSASLMGFVGNTNDLAITISGAVDGAGWIRHDGSSGKLFLWILNKSVGGLRRLSVNADLTGTAGTFIAATTSADYHDVTGWADNAGTVTFLISYRPANILNTRIDKVSITLADSITSGVLIRSVGLASQAWMAGGVPYALAHHLDSVQPTYFVIGAAGAIATIEAKLYAGVAEDRASTEAIATLPDVATASDGSIVVPLLKITGQSLSGASFGNVRAPALANLTRWPANTGLFREAADVLVIPGGVTRMYDGAGVSELGFNVFPPAPGLVAGGSGGTLTTGSYKVKIVYAWRDADNRIHRSAPSAPTTVSVSGALTINPNATGIAYYRITDRRGTGGVSHAFIEVYATDANPGADPPYYLATTFANVPTSDAATSGQLIFNNNYVGNEELYVGRDESVLENIAPPPSLAAAVFGNRLWLVAADDRRALWASKQIREGEGPAFNDESLILRLDDDAGDLVTLESFEDKLVAFKAAAPYGIWGAGPDDTGAGEFVDPMRLAGVGAGSPIVRRTEPGILYVASDNSGLWMIDRGLASTFLGLPVSDLVGLTVTDIRQHGRRIHVATSNGSTLVYDSVWARWYVFTDQPSAGAALYGGRYTYATPSGIVRREDVARWDEDGEPVRPAWETSWLALAGLAGYERTYRIHLIGDYLGAHRLWIRAWLNYGKAEIGWKFDAAAAYNDNEYGTTGNYGVGVYGGTSLDGRYHVVCRPMIDRQRMSALKFRVEEYFPDSLVSAGFALEAIAFELGIKPQSTRLPRGLVAARE